MTRMPCLYNAMRETTFNSSWPVGTISDHKLSSILARAMACCLAALSHHLNPGWLISGDISVVSLKGCWTNPWMGLPETPRRLCNIPVWTTDAIGCVSCGSILINLLVLVALHYTGLRIIKSLWYCNPLQSPVEWSLIHAKCTHRLYLSFGDMERWSILINNSQHM